MKSTLKALIGLIMAFVISAGLSGCGSNPDRTADHFMSLLVAGKHLEAQEMLGKDMKSMVGMMGGISDKSLNRYYRFGAFKSYTLTQLEKTDKSIRYKVAVVTSDGVSHEDYMDLVREDGRWMVSRF